jgi:hypothetical protein
MYSPHAGKEILERGQSPLSNLTPPSLAKGRGQGDRLLNNLLTIVQNTVTLQSTDNSLGIVLKKGSR